MNIIIFFLTTLSIIGIAVYIDWYLIEVKKYLLLWGYKFTRNCIVGFLFSLNCYHFDIEDTIKPYFVFIAIQVALFWILFDMFLNIARRKDIFYNGKNNLIDSVLSEFPDYGEIAIKVAFLFFSIYWFIKFI